MLKPTRDVADNFIMVMRDVANRFMMVMVIGIIRSRILMMVMVVGIIRPHVDDLNFRHTATQHAR